MPETLLPNQVERASNRAIHEGTLVQQATEHCAAIMKCVAFAQQRGERRYVYCWGRGNRYSKVPLPERAVRLRVYRWVRSQPGYSARIGLGFRYPLGAAMVIRFPSDRVPSFIRWFC